MQDGIAETRVGATLLYDSDPVAEEDETELKAAALFTAIRGRSGAAVSTAAPAGQSARGRKVLLVDHEDSFVHTLAGYIRTTGAEVTTLRHDFARAELQGGLRPDLVVLSPGPGRPADFAMSDTIDLLLERGIATVPHVPRVVGDIGKARCIARHPLAHETHRRRQAIGETAFREMAHCTARLAMHGEAGVEEQHLAELDSLGRHGIVGGRRNVLGHEPMAQARVTRTQHRRWLTKCSQE